MANNSKFSIILPVYLIASGLGWLLTIEQVLEPINWFWNLNLGVTGAVILYLVGWDKITVVVGTMFFVVTVLSVLSELTWVGEDQFLAISMLALGVLMLVSHFSGLRMPGWAGARPSAESPIEASCENRRAD